MTRDEFLTKAMGKHSDSYWWCFNCMAEKSPHQVTYEESCTLCGKQVEWIAAHIFTNPEEWTELLLWSQDDQRTYVPQGGPEKWTWHEFYRWSRGEYSKTDNNIPWGHARHLFNPERFANILAEFLGWREGK